MAEVEIKNENLVYAKPKLITDNVMHYCPGCSHGTVHKLIAEVIEEMGFAEKTVGVSPVGCSVFAYNYIDIDWIEAAHGRALAVATAVKRLYPGNLVFTYQGDGDAYNIGLAETLNAAYRNENICVFTVNNGNFGMTGGQMSWTTMPGQVTATSPMGRDTDLTGIPIKVPELVAYSFTPAYVARGAVTSPAEINKLKGYIKNAFEAQLNHEGYSLVEVMCSCPTNWGMDAIAAKKRLVDEVIPYYQLGEIKKRGE